MNASCKKETHLFRKACPGTPGRCELKKKSLFSMGARNFLNTNFPQSFVVFCQKVVCFF